MKKWNEDVPVQGTGQGSERILSMAVLSQWKPWSFSSGQIFSINPTNFRSTKIRTVHSTLIWHCRIYHIDKYSMDIDKKILLPHFPHIVNRSISNNWQIISDKFLLKQHRTPLNFQWSIFYTSMNASIMNFKMFGDIHSTWIRKYLIINLYLTCWLTLTTEWEIIQSMNWLKQVSRVLTEILFDTSIVQYLHMFSPKLDRLNVHYKFFVMFVHTSNEWFELFHLFVNIVMSENHFHKHVQWLHSIMDGYGPNRRRRPTEDKNIRSSEELQNLSMCFKRVEQANKWRISLLFFRNANRIRRRFHSCRRWSIWLFLLPQTMTSSSSSTSKKNRFSLKMRNDLERMKRVQYWWWSKFYLYLNRTAVSFDLTSLSLSSLNLLWTRTWQTNLFHVQNRSVSSAWPVISLLSKVQVLDSLTNGSCHSFPEREREWV